MSSSFNPSSSAGAAFRFTMADNFADRIRLQSGSGFHSSRSDLTDHYTFKNANGDIAGHSYGNGSFKSARGFPGPIGMF